jgi:prepilin signal peptidase PulO-like enzyme (type II secretory pathway)
MVWIVCAVVAGLLAGGLAPLVARRSLTRPVINSVPSEWELLGKVWSRPYRLAFLTDIASEDFASPLTARLWEHFVKCAQLPASSGESDALAEAAGEQLQQRCDLWRADVLAAASGADRDRLADLLMSDQLPSGEVNITSQDTAAMKAADVILSASADRNLFDSPAAPRWVATPGGGPDAGTLTRLPARVSMTRRIVSAVLAFAWVAALGALIPMTGETGVAFVAAAWLATGVGLFVVSFVDYDTMYIDWWFYLLALSATVVFSFAHAQANNDLSILVPAVATAFGVALFFEILNKVYTLIRKTAGQGFGDTLIVLVTVGLPVALTGSWLLGYLSLMSALLSAIVAFLVRKAVTGKGKDAPFAFGPFLALGPLLAVLIAAAFPDLLPF